MAVDILSGALSKAGCSGTQKAQHGNAVTFIAIKISAFNSIKDFRKKVSRLVSHVKNSRLKKGYKYSGKKLYLSHSALLILILNQRKRPVQ